MRVFICNYDIYQDEDNYKSGTESGTESGIHAEQKRNDKQELKNERNNIYTEKEKKSAKRVKSEGEKKIPSDSELEKEFEKGKERRTENVDPVVWVKTLKQMLLAKREGAFKPDDNPEWLLDFDSRELATFVVEVSLASQDIKTIARELYDYYKESDFKFIKSNKPIKRYKAFLKNVVRSNPAKWHGMFGRTEWVQ